MKHKSTAQIEIVTPLIAAQWLATNTEHQRSVTKSHSSFLEKEMKGNNWFLTGETFIFDWNGMLIEGQHRCHAVINSGATIESWVIRGIDPAAFAYINRGKIRTTGNIAQIAGIKDANTVMSFANAVWKYRRAIKTGGSINTYDRSAPHELLDIYNANKSGFDAALAPSGLAYREVGLGKSIGGPIHFLANEASRQPELVDLFFEGLIYGKGLQDGDPVLYFRNLMIRSKMSQMKINAYQAFAIGAKAWNLFKQGKSAKLIRFQDGEPFPTFI